MSTIQEIESAITGLPLEHQRSLRDWLDDQLEDELELSDEFKTKVERAKQQLAEGHYSRVRQPGGSA